MEYTDNGIQISKIRGKQIIVETINWKTYKNP